MSEEAEIIDKLLEENEALKEKLHEKNMQIIKLNELLGELIDKK